MKKQHACLPPKNFNDYIVSFATLSHKEVIKDKAELHFKGCMENYCNNLPISYTVKTVSP